MILFGVTLFLLLVPVVLALPSASRTRVARRPESHQSQTNNPLEQVAGAISNAQVSQNWAGAIWSQSTGTFKSITGTFTAPTPSGSTGASAAAWVGIDGYSCKTAILQTGVEFTVSSDGPTYGAWYEFYPAPSSNFSGITISPGDALNLTVTTASPSSGTVTIDNLTNGQTVSQDLYSIIPLCGQDAEWIVEDYKSNGVLVPLANFGTVTFMNAEATGAGQTYTPSGATITEIEQNNQVLTSTSTDGSSVTIHYV